MNKGNSEDNGQVYEWPQCVYAFNLCERQSWKNQRKYKKILIKSIVKEEEGKEKGIDIT